MSRVLFVVPPFLSHVQPTVAIGAELVRRGHAVAWTGYAELAPVLPAWATFYPITSAFVAVLRERGMTTTRAWLGGMKALFEGVLAPMAADMLPGVEDAIAQFRPDAMLVDQQAIAGALAARRRGVVWGTSAPTAMLFEPMLPELPKVGAWLVDLLARVQRDAGLPTVPWPDRSDALVLLYVSREFVGQGAARVPAHYRFVGPLRGERVESPAFPWEKLSATTPRIFVSLGSVVAGRGGSFFAKVAEAFADTDLQVVLQLPPGFEVAAPPNFIVRPWVPLLQLYPWLTAVLSHAGSTVVEAIAHGLPSVVAPVAGDQFIFARCAVACGAARRISFTRSSAAEIRTAMLDVLDNPEYRTAARRIQGTLERAGGVAAAADAVEALAMPSLRRYP